MKKINSIFTTLYEETNNYSVDQGNSETYVEESNPSVSFLFEVLNKHYNANRYCNTGMNPKLTLFIRY